MTVVDLTDRRAAQPAEEWASPEERRAAALRHAATEAAAGRPVTGTELGRRYGMSDRWGRNLLAELTRNGDGAGSRPAAAVPAGNGNTQVTGTGSRQKAVPASGNGNRPAAAPVAVPATVRPDRQPAAASPTAGRAPTAAIDRPGLVARAQAWFDRHTNRLITLVVAAAAAVMSYGHMHEVALLAGEPRQLAWLWPITADGLIVAALRQGNRWWLSLGLAVSVSSNVLTHYPELVQTEVVSAGITAWPPLALLGTHCLLHSRKKEGNTT